VVHPDLAGAERLSRLPQLRSRDQDPYTRTLAALHFRDSSRSQRSNLRWPETRTRLEHDVSDGYVAGSKAAYQTSPKIQQAIAIVIDEADAPAEADGEQDHAGLVARPAQEHDQPAGDGLGQVDPVVLLERTNGRDVTLDVPENLVAVGRPSETVQVLRNLLDNACKWAQSRVAVEAVPVDVRILAATNKDLEAEIERRIALKDDAVTCYLDLDNLKAFNDYYGYAKANAVIRQPFAFFAKHAACSIGLRTCSSRT
jgi:hypothetical protein